jgi:hypothetical protein
MDLSRMFEQQRGTGFSNGKDRWKRFERDSGQAHRHRLDVLGLPPGTNPAGRRMGHCLMKPLVTFFVNSPLKLGGSERARIGARLTMARKSWQGVRRPAHWFLNPTGRKIHCIIRMLQTHCVSLCLCWMPGHYDRHGSACSCFSCNRLRLYLVLPYPRARVEGFYHNIRQSLLSLKVAYLQAFLSFPAVSTIFTGLQERLCIGFPVASEAFRG